MSEIEFNGEVLGLQDLAMRLDPQIVRRKLAEGLLRGLIKMQTTIKADKLSGQVLNVRTGTLRRSINFTPTSPDDFGSGEEISGQVGSFAGYQDPKGNAYAASYAAVHEYGGTFQIPAHQRRIGYDRESSRTALLNKLGGIRKTVETYGVSQVKAHSATYPQRSFLRSTMQEQVENIKGYLLASMREGLAAQ